MRRPSAALLAASDAWSGAGNSTQEPRRRVSVPGAAFEATANGMGLKRKACERATHSSASAPRQPAGAPAAATRGAPHWGAPVRSAAASASSSAHVPAVTSLDFKRQRMADAARAAKGSVLCSFFCRHGRCDGRGGAECPFEHDPDRVAMCQDFLHGTCHSDRDPPCSLSHTPCAENMPMCRLFARGLCVDSGCAYSHVHLGVSAPICEAFAGCGYCANGTSCGKRHEMSCAAHVEGGGCALGDRCKLGRRAKPPAPQSGAQRSKVIQP